MNKKLFLVLIFGLLLISFVSADYYKEESGIAGVGSATTTGQDGVNITMTAGGWSIASVEKYASSSATKVYIKNSTGSLLGSTTFSGDIANFTIPIPVESGETYSILVDNNGGSYSTRYSAGGALPVSGTYLDWIDGVPGSTGGGTTNAYDVVAIGLESGQISKNITLTTPVDNLVINDVGDYFNVTYSSSNYTFNNATYYLWKGGTLFNQTTVSLSGSNLTTSSLFIDGFTIGTYEWNVFGCFNNATYSNCSWSDNGNFSFSVSASVTNLSYSNITYETSRETYSANMELVPGTTLYDVKLNYGGTDYPASFTNVSDVYYITSSIDIPLSNGSAVNKSFYWKTIYSIGTGSYLYDNSSMYNQTILPLSFSVCNGSSLNRTLEFKLYDETNLTPLTNFNFLATFNIWLGTGQTYVNYSVNNLSIANVYICSGAIDYNYSTNAIIQYEKVGYGKRNYYLVNNTLNNIQQNISLFALPTASSTSFLITLKDASQLPVSDAYLYIQRYYPGTNAYETVAMGITDNSGNVPIDFEAQTEDYRIVAQKNGQVLYQSPVQKVYCTTTPCTLPLQTQSDGISTWTSYGNLSSFIYSLTFDNSTNIWSYEYIDTSGTTHYGRLWVYSIDNVNGKQTICDTNSTSSGALLTCNITGYSGTIYAEAYISRSPEILVWAKSVIINSVREILSFDGLFWALIIIILLILGGLGIAGVTGGIIGLNLGLLATSTMGIALFGPITTFAFIIGSLVILWVIKE
ncbi:hypothetical protein C0585_01005 [Candidatus Woesearchaeota archaeon]|uniref:hypothetical protein n=1 Tax=uncultured Arcobacter sp. TaxID=165434 RepID=UPI000CB8DB3F|nr:hypothetical protein [uncultured Arcobacter sp.]PLW80762.1 MAG: hypothetical protein C0585_01005 [Candidatus Woesearchaeota archaeon]